MPECFKPRVEPSRRPHVARTLLFLERSKLKEVELVKTLFERKGPGRPKKSTDVAIRGGGCPLRGARGTIDRPIPDRVGNGQDKVSAAELTSPTSEV